MWFTRLAHLCSPRSSITSVPKDGLLFKALPQNCKTEKTHSSNAMSDPFALVAKVGFLAPKMHENPRGRNHALQSTLGLLRPSRCYKSFAFHPR